MNWRSEFESPRDRVEWFVAQFQAEARSPLPERVKGAARSAVFGMLECAIQAQRDGGPSVDVILPLDELTARALGLWGQGEIRLSLWPAFDPRAREQEKATTRLPVRPVPGLPGQASQHGREVRDLGG